VEHRLSGISDQLGIESWTLKAARVTSTARELTLEHQISRRISGRRIARGSRTEVSHRSGARREHALIIDAADTTTGHARARS
jgi:hypothetical protein